MINTKETLEETLTEYGVPFTDALADRLLKEIYYESEEYLSYFKDDFLRVLMTTDSGDYIDNMDYVSVKEVKEALEIASMNTNSNYFCKDISR